MKYLSCLRATYYQLRAFRSSERGFMFIAIILIMLVIFSITIVSGADDFAFSPEPTGKPTPSTGPTATPSAGTITPTPNQSAGWSITFDFLRCNNGVAEGNILATGPRSATIIYRISDNSISQDISTKAFDGGEVRLGLELTDQNQSPIKSDWQLELNSNGQSVASYNGTPISCS